MTVSITFSKETGCAGDEEVLGAEELRDPNPGGVILRRLAPETVRCWERRRRRPRACTGRRRAARQGGIAVPPRQQRRRREQQAGPAVLVAAAAASGEEDGAGEVHA